MPVSLSKKILNLCLVSTLFCPVLPAQATEVDEPLTVTLEQTVQFSDLEGEDILVPAGDYSVVADKEQLTLTGSNSRAITIEANEGSHTTEIPAPSVIFISPEAGDPTNAHLLVVYYPVGKTLEALGRDPEVISRGSMEPTAVDLEYIDPALVTFPQSVHFTAPDGTSVVVQQGTYTAEASEKSIRLIPSADSQTSVVIEAQQGTHDTELEDFLALSLPGTTPKELDLHHVMLLLPSGQTLETTGSYSGIHTRNWFKRTFNKTKKTVRRTYKKVRKTPAFKTVNQAAKQVGKTAKQGTKIVGTGINQGVSATKWAAGQAGKGIVIGANETWKGMKWAGKQIGIGAKIAACHTTVTLIKAGKAVSGLMNSVIPSIQSKKKGAQDRFKNDKSFHDQLITSVTQSLQTHQEKIPELKNIAALMNASKGKLDAIFSAKNFCGDSVATMDKQLMSLGMVPKFATVRSRGVNDEHFYLGYQISLGGGVGAGLQVGLMGVTDLRGNGGKYWFIGPQGITNAAAGVTAEVAFFPKVSLASFEGWGSGVGISAGPPSKVVSGAVDIMLDEKVDKFQGFGFGPGVGVGVSPVDAAFSYTHSWKY